MTEQQIESRVERMVDSLDKRYLRGEFTESEYEREMANIDQWAERQYRFAART